MHTDIRRTLAEKGLRVTPQRLIVYKTLVEMKSHPTAEELTEEVRRRFPAISPGTVYNTLDLLVELGMARVLPAPGGGSSRFDGDASQHAHAVCRRCGNIIDLPVPGLDQAVAEAAAEHGFVVQEQSVEVRGTCADCAQAAG